MTSPCMVQVITRSFCYCDDLIDGFVRLMDQDELVGPVNIGNPGEFTILELAEKEIAQTGSKSKIVFEPLPQDDPKQRQPDITLAKEKLGWEPTVSLDEGLKPTIAYFDQLLRVLRSGALSLTRRLALLARALADR